MRPQNPCLPAKLEGNALAAFEREISRALQPVKAGEALVRRGDAMHALYALHVGVLNANAQHADAEGTEQVVGFRFPGRVIGLAKTSLDRWVCTIVALEDSWVCRIPMRLLDGDGGGSLPTTSSCL